MFFAKCKFSPIWLSFTKQPTKPKKKKSQSIYQRIGRHDLYPRACGSIMLNNLITALNQTFGELFVLILNTFEHKSAITYKEVLNKILAIENHGILSPAKQN